jgi:hypothetical protein
MSAPRRVSSERVRSVIEATRGNVAHAAAELGIAENNLRKRIEQERLDLVALRAKRPPCGPVRIQTRPSRRDSGRSLRPAGRAACRPHG